MQDQQFTTLVIRMQKDQDRGGQPNRNLPNVSAQELNEKYATALAKWVAGCMADSNVGRSDVTNVDKNRITDELLRINLVKTGDRSIDPVSTVLLAKAAVYTAVERAVNGRY